MGNTGIESPSTPIIPPPCIIANVLGRRASHTQHVLSRDEDSSTAGADEVRMVGCGETDRVCDVVLDTSGEVDNARTMLGIASCGCAEDAASTATVVLCSLLLFSELLLVLLSLLLAAAEGRRTRREARSDHSTE